MLGSLLGAERRVLLPVIALMSALAGAALACSVFPGGPSESSGDPTVEATAVGDTQAPRCEREGYPCSYAEADPAAIELGVQVMDIADAVINDGGTIPDAGARLELEEDVVELVYDQLSLRFRVDGGPPMWLIDPVIMQSEATTAAANHVLARPIGQDDGPVGDQKEGEEPKHRSLVLAPFLWDFGTNEGPEVDRLIGTHDNYECDGCQRLVVSYRSKLDADKDGKPDDFSSGGVTLTDFQGWDRYDIIHVSTHGVQNCLNELDYTPQFSTPDNSDCYTALFTGISVHQMVYETMSASPAFGAGGVAWAKLAGGEECGGLEAGTSDYNEADCFEAGLWWQVVTTDFFKLGYPGGLDDKLIFLSACESMKGRDLAEALAGDNTTVLGWTESVDAGIAEKVATKFYELYIGNGLEAEPAFEKAKMVVGEGGLLTRLRPKGGGSYPNAVPEIIRGGSPEPRGREVIALRHVVFHQELEDGASLPVNGIAGDGKPDRLPVLVQVDGIEPGQDPASFTIHLKVNDTEASQTFVPVHQVGEYSYWGLPYIELPADVSQLQGVKIETWVDLPEGGRSRNVIEGVDLAGCGWTGEMSGARNGPISGHEVMNMQEIADMDPQDLADALGGAAGVPSIPGMGPLGGGDLAMTLGLVTEEGDHTFFVTERGQGAFNFGVSEVYGSQGLNFTASNDENGRLTGTVSGTMVNATMTGGSMTIDADFIWDDDSFCSFGVMLGIVKDPLPADLLAGGAPLPAGR